tara:strand:+ start:1393 stop:2259 length:867 start_codon:yes stop_codon:yes gene_type:complete
MQTISQNTDFTWQKIENYKYKLYTGVNISSGCYTSFPINQHKSSWCGCCYMVSTLQMIQDRVHVQLGKRNSDIRIFPWVIFDLQSMLDHYQAYKAPFTRGWNACKGGLPLHLLNAIETNKCPLIFQKKSSEWLGHPQDIQTILKSDIKVKIKNSKRIIDVNDVEQKIIENGPVVLSISGPLLKNVDKYGFVIADNVLKADHAVSVVGWIYHNGKKYWVARNSWGEKEVPSSLPEDMSCVSLTGNTCKIKMEPWVGDPKNPGYVYIPSDYSLLNDIHDSPWFETEVEIE